ncbi:uncharacterized protein LOC117893281 [Drosophila subobscura]|uniref:uncharacterized protein LOC117893281 n=1 Tax=Drosophila subobscura TaxID=7241 RepID=UPI00155A92BA|nr:uncharacterized protein LOC117893281 [Drosophila subobscura]
MSTKVPTVLCLLLLAGALTVSRGEEFPQCVNVEPETFVMAIEDCASYIYCNGEDSFRDSCPEHTYFDDKAQECAFDDAGFCLREAPSAMEETLQPAESAPEQEHPSTTGAPESVPSTEAPAPSVPVGRPHCDASSDSFHPHPQRCEYFYRCLSGYLTIVRCPYKYGWDSRKQQCLPLAEAQCHSL